MISRRDILTATAAGAMASARQRPRAQPLSATQTSRRKEQSMPRTRRASLIPGPQNPGIGEPVSLGAVPAGDRRRRPAAILGIVQQCAKAHSEWRLGAPGDASGFRDFRYHLGGQHAIDRRRHKGIALASGRRMGLHDLWEVPGHCSRRQGPRLCLGREGRRPLVLSSGLPAFTAGASPGRLRVHHLL